jgi:hypothetical protein
MPSGKRGPGPKKAAVERREARFLDRKRKRHASQACRGGFADRPGGSQPPRFSALRSLRLPKGARHGALPPGFPARKQTAIAPPLSNH